MSDHQSKNTPAQPTAATPTPDKPAAKPKPKPDPKNKPKPHKEAQLQPLQTYTGTVGAFGANADGIYDKFVLDAADTTRTVKFPPHFGQALQALAQPGQPVAVLGFLKTTPKGDEHLHLARLEAGGTTARPAPAPGDHAEATTVAGTIAELLHDPKGHLRGLRLAPEAAELRLPPHLAAQLAERLVPGAAVEASGRQRGLHPGEVAAPAALSRCILSS